jgi:hypothetical protein
LVAETRILVFAALLAVPCSALADKRPAMAEPLIGESVTDIDSDEPGETEIDVTGATLHSWNGAAWGSGAIEIELRLTRRLGVSLEVGLIGGLNQGLYGDLNAAGSYTVWHDFRQQLHLQIEARALALDTEFSSPRLRTIPENETPQFAVGLRGAWRWRWLTLRFGIGPSIGGSYAVPVWADAALFTEWSWRYARLRGLISFAGIEAVTDWASTTPVVVSPEIVLGFRLGDVPTRIGFGAPLYVGNRGRGPFAGGLLRVLLELDRD